MIINEIYIVENFKIPGSWNLLNIPIYLVGEKYNQGNLANQNLQGNWQVCRLLGKKPLTINKQGKYLLIDQIQDPGNLGTIIRTADSVGLSAGYFRNGYRRYVQIVKLFAQHKGPLFTYQL
ncbi:hypothetical protein KHA80_16595 [Anaerobacillus sp. HL2]|nr:hypothetical protein KHA80_16595 [Anaerobacillus sp. HL2]